MNETVSVLNTILATSGILLFLVSTVLLLDLYSSRIFEKFVNAWGISIGLLITLSASIMSLIYSEVFGFVPCGLCWLQRIFLYPQVFLLSLALIYKEKVAARYGLALSIPGIIISIYQHYIQMGGAEFINCPASSADCAKRIMFEFDFMTLPLLTGIIFLFLIILYTYILKTKNI